MEYGSQIKIAKKLGVSRQYMSDLINRRRRVSYERAKILEAACAEVGMAVSWQDWIENHISTNPIFNGEPQEEVESELLT